MRERRKERIEKLIEQEISLLIRDILELSGSIISINKVLLSNDLSTARIFFSALENEDKILEILEKNSGHLRYLLARKLNLRYTPKLRFLKDEEEEKQRRLEELFEKLRDKKEDSGETEEK
ncbi:MAG: 30S ribosome-binding factor RbfA [Candidatus Aminicenantes bacterium]|nr:30S ribosome-binding factor RbfA [Candidatus Aminicenantes bacterium]